jgi:hypothetical protein
MGGDRGITSPSDNHTAEWHHESSERGSAVIWRILGRDVVISLVRLPRPYAGSLRLWLKGTELRVEAAGHLNPTQGTPFHRMSD